MIEILFVLKMNAVTGQMAQWLRVLVVLVEDPGLVLGTHMAAHNYL